MKINIQFNFVEGAWGGGNQFLKNLRKYLLKRGEYVESPFESEVIIFNSHHALGEIVKLKRRFPGKIFLHRIDGPIQLIRGDDGRLDRQIYKFNNKIADSTIFQSKWSQDKNYLLGSEQGHYDAVIYNAPDPEIFFRSEIKKTPRRRIKLIAVSWSDNHRKGFDCYKYLDEYLDFTTYEMIFVGNSPVKFRNIKAVAPINSRRKLAELLRDSDIFVTASEKDPCSNALIEALACGLPAVALNDGGHPELVGGGGELFENYNDMIPVIKRVAENIQWYASRIKKYSIEKVVAEYSDLAARISADIQTGGYSAKKIGWLDYLSLKK